MNTLLAQEIYDKALACGYDSCGIVPLDALDFYKERLIKRLEDVPESKEVYAHSKDFLALKEKYPWAQSIVVCTKYFGTDRNKKASPGGLAIQYRAMTGFLMPQA